MAPAELSAPGGATYNSDTMSVGDGTWDFDKNSFLLPNLLGLNFETMQYSMGNRFSTVAQYHSLITAHGVLAIMVFLFIVPIAVFTARFHRGVYAIRYHAYLQVIAVGLSTVVFILGFFAVGLNRSLTNPHHGIGVAIYVMVLCQALGGRLITHIRKRSIRVMFHQWLGRAIALLGIAQVPLGLTLYGSPKVIFILYAIWMTFLLVLYFILSYRHEVYRDEIFTHGARSEGGPSRYTESGRTERHGSSWLGPLAAGAGIWALMRGRKNGKEEERERSRSRSRSRSRPEVISSHPGGSYLDDEKQTTRTDTQKGGFMDRVLGVVGAGALAKRFLDRRDSRKHNDDQYSAVETDTPSRHRRRPSRSQLTESSFTDDYFSDVRRHDARSSIPPPPGEPSTLAGAISAAERPTRPATPQRSHGPARSDMRSDSYFASDYDSYVSPSRRAREEPPSGGGGGIAKGLLTGLGLGWFAKKMQDRKDKKVEDERLREEDERRDGRHGSRYTGDGRSSPSRTRRRPPPIAGTMTTMTGDSELSSAIEPRPTGTSSSGPPMPPLGPAGAPPRLVSHSRSHSRSHSNSKRDPSPAHMPRMPPDPQGILRRDDSAGEGPQRRHSSRRRRRGELAAAEAAASASRLAAEEESRHPRNYSHSQAPSQPVSVKVKYHDDRGNVTLRRLTEEEQSRQHRRRRSDSVSSLSGGEKSSGRRHYRRDTSSARRSADEAAAERLIDEPLSSPTAVFSGSKRLGKDSAYYSGPAGPSGDPPSTPMTGNQTVSSIGSQESHGTWSAMSPSPSGPAASQQASQPPPSVSASAADRRRRRRLERRDQRPTTVDYE